MKSLVILAGAALLAPVAFADSSKTYPVEPFERIHVSESIELKAQVGPAQSVVATTSGDDFGRLSVKVVDGTLVLGRMHRWYFMDWFGDRRFVVTVSVPALRGVTASSSGRAEITGAITRDTDIRASSSGRVYVAEVQGGKVTVQASSSGRIDLTMLRGDSLDVRASSSGRISMGELHVPAVAMGVSSSGRIEAGGSCESLDARASSSGRIDAPRLRCVNVTADVSSSGRVQAFASQSVTAHASSSGRVVIGGRPGRVDQHTSSSGSIDITD
jgi:hypothetical protein